MTYELLLSEKDAMKASSDVAFATKLLECTKQTVPPEVSEEKSSAEDISITKDCDESDLNYRWSHDCILMLLSTYQELIDKFKNGKQSQKKYWEVVASKLNNENFKVTGTQCAAKLRSLKKTYKSVKDHNSKSGNDRRTWQYYQIMDDIFKENAWAEPIAVASSSGLCKKRNTDSDTESNSNNQSKIIKSSSSSVAVQLFQKRIEQKEEHERNKNKRHEERLEIDKQLVNILTKLVEK